MIGMVLVTHGALANAMRDAMEHVVGKQKNLATVCIESDAEFESQRAEIARRIAEVDTLRQEVLAWATKRNHERKTVHWRFSQTDTRTKLQRHDQNVQKFI